MNPSEKYPTHFSYCIVFFLFCCHWRRRRCRACNIIQKKYVSAEVMAHNMCYCVLFSAHKLIIFERTQKTYDKKVKQLNADVPDSTPIAGLKSIFSVIMGVAFILGYYVFGNIRRNIRHMYNEMSVFCLVNAHPPQQQRRQQRNTNFHFQFIFIVN